MEGRARTWTQFEAKFAFTSKLGQKLQLRGRGWEKERERQREGTGNAALYQPFCEL